MTITSITPDVPGQVGVNPRRVKIVCNNSYSEIITENFLKSSEAQGFTFYATDFFDIAYGTASTTLGTFTCIISSDANITLKPYIGEGSVTTPVVTGNIPKFSGTTGLMVDSGISPTNAAKTKMVMANSATVVGEFAIFTDTAGTIDNAGAKILAGTTPSYAGGGTSNAFAVTGLSVASVGSAVIRASTNAVSIAKALPGTNTLTITFSADPGASTTVDYIYATAGLT